MALVLEKDRAVNLVDRTLPEIYNTRESCSRLDLIDFCWMLADLGVDFIEIDSRVLQKLGRLPSGINYLLRIQSEEDIELTLNNSLRYCLVYEGMLVNTRVVEILNSRNIQVTVECKVESLADIFRLRKLGKLSCLQSIHSIRLTGLSSFISLSWIRAAHGIGRLLNKPVEVCPENRFYCATSIALDAIMNNISSLSLSFTGYGGWNGYAALEEVLASANLLINPLRRLNLKSLPELGRCFSRLTGRELLYNKPILGKNLFLYESGIHADGIEKNPSTYEPFEPEMVGQTRTLSIGKHSGKKAIVRKLRDLGLECNSSQASDILEHVRERSVQLGRSLQDGEICEVHETITERR